MGKFIASSRWQLELGIAISQSDKVA